MDLPQEMNDAELLQAQNNIEDGAASGDFEMPSLDKLLQMIEGMDMTPEQKEELKQGIRMGPGKMPGMFDERPGAGYQQYLLLLLAVILIILVFGKILCTRFVINKYCEI